MNRLKPIVPQRDNKKRSGARHLSIYRTILLVAGLSGCAMMPPAPAPLPAAPEPEPVPAVVVVPQGSARELFIAGVDALQHGDRQKAKPLLQRVLALEPNHKDAATLLQQIDADPVEMLGKENFPYKVQPGDTLSLIAKHFLGDRFKFYVLARYNDLAVSDKLEAGQLIKIPGKKPPPSKAPPATVATVATVAEQPPPPDTSSPRLAEAKALYTDGRFADAINALERIRSERGPGAEVDDFLITVYSAYAKKLTGSGQFAEANKLLSRALSTYPANERLKRQIDQVETNRIAEQAYQEGNQWLNDGEPEKAYTAYAKALKLAPEHAGAKAALLKIRAQVVDA
ncbi:MAG TPA: LysM domain-containing protein, partial [Nitrosospira sp.]